MDLYKIDYRIHIDLGYQDGTTEQVGATGVEFLWADTEDEARTAVIHQIAPTGRTPEIIACDKCPAEMLPIFEAMFPRPGSTLTEDEQDDALLAALGIEMDDD